MILGYNTNGLVHHELIQAIRLLAEIGYGSVAITIDHHALSPFDPQSAAQRRAVARLLETLGMRSVIETGARFLLDPWQKHEPSLMSADSLARRRRIEFYRCAIDCAAELQSDCVAIWSGVLRDSLRRPEAMGRLVEGLEEVLDHAAQARIPIGFEPEPGMFIDSLAAFEQLLQRIDSPWLKLTLDIGHVHCQGEGPIARQVHRWSDRLVNVHLEDMRRGEHRHLMLGEGEIQFEPVIAALARCGYRGGVHVELSAHSHEAPQVARRAFELLQPLIEQAQKNRGSADHP